MARPLRFDRPNTMYHVLSRGNERGSIFDDVSDCDRFAELLGTVSERYGIEVWAYVLMGNHYHLLIRTAERNLSRAMQWLGVTCSGYYNRKYERTGHLFQGRFKSFVVSGRNYLRRLLLYIHRNPLRAKMVERLADYPWSSYPCLAYGRQCKAWLARGKVLQLFDGSAQEFRRAVQEYSEEEDRLLENLRFGLLLAGERVAAQFRQALGTRGHREQPQGRRLLRSRPVREQVEQLRKALGLTPQEVKEFQRPIRRRARPLRDVLIWLLWKNSDYTLQEIGEYFSIGYTTVGNARVRGEHHLKQNRKLRATLKDLLCPTPLD